MGKPMSIVLAALAAGLTAAVQAASSSQGVGDSTAYDTYCIVCHGPDLSGVEGLGISLTESELIDSSSEEEIVAFIRAGRMPDDPDTVSVQPMPAFDYLPQEELLQIAAYLKQH